MGMGLQQQLLNTPFGLLIFSLPGMLIDQYALLIEEILGRPIALMIGIPVFTLGII